MNRSARVVGVHPVFRGFGWLVLDMDGLPLDWGVVERRSNRNEHCLAAFRDILESYAPLRVALEAYRPAVRSQGLVDLTRSLANLGREYGAPVRFHDRNSVCRTLDVKDGSTRQQMAIATAAKLDVLLPRLPRKRAIWESEKSVMALFVAAALALTDHGEGNRP